MRLGNQGASVRQLQKQLNQLGYTLAEDGIFGPATEKAVKAFQKSANILVDGIAGKDTLAMLNQKLNPVKPIIPEQKISLADEALKIAATQIGVRENPRNSNRGKEVEMYLASIGLGGGYSWCMAFVYWCVNGAAKKLQTENPLYKTGGVLMQWNQRPGLRVINPKAGDIFIMDYGQGKGHTGFISSVEGNYIHTIEGNTNQAGSREGDGVYRRKRSIASCKGFLRV